MNKERQSNIELLRIIAMFLVLFMHGVYSAIPDPTPDDFETHFIQQFVRMWSSGLSYVNVNVFVLISGWFGLNFKKKAFCNILFQSFFAAIILIVIGYIFFRDSISPEIVIKLLYPGQSWWFVSSYLGLMMLCPMLNAFIEKASRLELKNYIIAFYVFQMAFGLLFLDSGFFKNGISILSFVGLYLLGRYLKLYPSRLSSLSKQYDILIYLFMGFIWACLMFIFADRSSLISITILDKIHANNNPIIIMGAVYLLLFFSKIKMNTNKIINWVSISCFAIYLLHCNPILYVPYRTLMFNIYENNSGIKYILVVLSAIIIISIICIFLDKIRIFLWNHIYKMVQTFFLTK